jgi:hypothetical protein
MYAALTYTLNGCLFTIYNTLGNIWPEDFTKKLYKLRPMPKACGQNVKKNMKFSRQR